MRRIFCLIVAMCVPVVAAAAARTLHYGDSAVELTSEKATSPALHVQFDSGEMAYGALYDTTCIPKNTLHIAYDDKEYWLGPFCGLDKVPYGMHCKCGYGYYCPDADTRIVCTGGAIACNTLDATADATAESGYLNRLLTLAEANALLPVTDVCEYESIPDIFHFDSSGADSVRTGTLEPGTYLFVVRTVTIFCGNSNKRLSTYSAVFDHPVSYKTTGKSGVVQLYIDTKGPEFKSDTIRIPICDNTIQTNVTGITFESIPKEFSFYRLK